MGTESKLLKETAAKLLQYKRYLLTLLVLVVISAFIILLPRLFKSTTETRIGAASSSVKLEIRPSTNTLGVNTSKNFELWATFTGGSAQEKIDLFKTEIVFPKEFILADGVNFITSDFSGLTYVIRRDTPEVANMAGRIVLNIGAASPGSGPATGTALKIAQFRMKAIKVTATNQEITIDASKTQVVNNSSQAIPLATPASAKFTISGSTVTATVTPAPTGTPAATSTIAPTATTAPVPTPTINPNWIKIGSIFFKAKPTVGQAQLGFKDSPQSIVVEKDKTGNPDILGQTQGLTINIGDVANAPKLIIKGRFRSVAKNIGNQTIIVRLKKNDQVYEFKNIAVTFDDQGIFTSSPVILFSGLLPTGPFEIFVKGPKHLAKRFENITLTQNTQTLDFTGEVLEPGDTPPQNGIINSADISRIVELLDTANPSVEELYSTDLNFDGAINGGDINELIVTLSTKYDEE